MKFCELEELSLVRFVLESMWESHIRPNEITHATVLRFFTVTGNKKEFSLYAKRMRGLRQGLALADPAKALSLLLKGRVRIFGKNLHKVAEKARMNQEVYSALIVGLLRFFDPEDAMYWYRSMIDQGWRPTVEMLTAIIQKSYVCNDWSAGIAAWEQFPTEALKATAVAYEWILRLCQRCGQFDAYSEIIDDGVREGTLPATVLAFSRLPRTQDVGAILGQATSKVAAQKGQKTVDVTLRKRLRLLRKFEATEDRPHLLDNALYLSSSSKTELNANIDRLAGDAEAVTALRLSVSQYEKALQVLSVAIAVTIDEANNRLPMDRIHKSIIKVGLAGHLANIPSERSPATLQDLYDHYRSTVASKLDRSPRIANAPSMNQQQTLIGPLECSGPPRRPLPLSRPSKSSRELPASTKWLPPFDYMDNGNGCGEARA